MSGMFDKLSSPGAMNMIAQFEGVFAKVPFKLPSGFVNFLVSIAPYLAIISAVLGILAGPLGLVLGVLSLATMDIRIIVNVVVSLVVMVASALIALKSFKPLKAREMFGWILMFWNQILSVVMLLVGLVLGGTGSVGGLIGAVIGFYVLFQMKPSYH
jgi:hypothetical protein